MQRKLGVLLALCVIGSVGMSQAQAESKNFTPARLDKAAGTKAQFRSVCYGNTYSSPYCSSSSYCYNNYCSPCYSYNYCSPCYSYCSPSYSYSYCSPSYSYCPSYDYCSPSYSYCSPSYSYCSPSCIDYSSSYSYCSPRSVRHTFKACHARLYPKGNKHH